MHSIETLKNLLNSGASLRIDAKTVSLNSLNELAAIAHTNSALLIITHANQILKDSLERLAVVGGAFIRFEF